MADLRKGNVPGKRPLFREWAARAALIGGSVLVVIGAIEVGLRVAGYDPMGRVIDGREAVLRRADDPLLRYELTPGASGRAWDAEVTVNAHGFRDDDSAPGPHASHRIVVLGDSVTFGKGVAEDERFTEVLEDSLARASGRPVEVLNMGVGGYDTLQEVVFLERTGLAFEPDHVVLAYCVNDIGEATVNPEQLDRLLDAPPPYYRLRVVQALATIGERRRLEAAFRAMNTEEGFLEANRGLIAPVDGDATLMEMAERLARQVGPPVDVGDDRRARDSGRRSGGRGSRGAGRAGPNDDDIPLAWYASPARLGKLAFALDRLAGVRDAHDFPVTVAILPWLDDDPRWKTAYDMVAHMARQRGFDVVDLSTALPPARLARLRAKRRDPVHPNAEGHRLLARGLQAALLERMAATSDDGT